MPAPCETRATSHSAHAPARSWSGCTYTGPLPRPQSRAEAEPLRAYAQPRTPGNRTRHIMKTSVGRRKRMPSPLCRSLREWKTQEGNSDRNTPQFTLAERLVRSVPQDGREPRRRRLTQCRFSILAAGALFASAGCLFIRLPATSASILPHCAHRRPFRLQ